MLSPSAPGRVLLVDDDPTTLRLLRAILMRGSFVVETASDGAQGLERLRQQTPAAFDAVLTDYQMPVLDGLQFLEQIRLLDPTLATIIATGDSERTTLTASLKGGVSDFLEKPCEPLVVLAAVARAISLTRRQRDLLGAERRLAEIRTIQQRLAPSLLERVGRPGQLDCELTTRICPVHEAGGDFVSVFRADDGSVQLMLGDVSGHGVREGFIATYFQGMIKGMQATGVAPARIAEVCNKFLLVEWSGGEFNPLPSSLSAVFVNLDLVRRELQVFNCGCPALQLQLPDQPPSPLAAHSSPLGWFETLAPGLATVPLPDSGSCCLWSDGLLDQAKQLGVSPHTIAARLLLTPLEGLPALHLASQASDDILVARLRWFPPDQGETEDLLPLFHEALPGDSASTIDAFQLRFERNLRHALPAIPARRFTPILLCAREALLNALNHGCAGLHGAAAHLTAGLRPRQQRLEITVSDPGPGRPQALTTRVGSPTGVPDLLAGTGHVSLGLEMIQYFTVAIREARRGAELTMEFDLAAA